MVSQLSCSGHHPRVPHLRGEPLREACAGTRISDDAGAIADAVGSGKGLVKGFATIDNVALINVEGTGMVRAAHVAHPIVHAKRAAMCSRVSRLHVQEARL